MAHPKLSLVSRSLLTVSTAALIAGPMAGIAAAQVDLGTSSEVEKILVDGELVEAIKIDGVWVDPDTLDPIEGLEDTVNNTTDTVNQTIEDTVVDKPSEATSEPGNVLPDLDGEPAPTPQDPTDITDPVTDSPKQGAGGTPTPIGEGSSGGSQSTSDGASNGAGTGGTSGSRGDRQHSGTTTASTPASHYLAGSGNVNFNPGASPWSGFGSMSSLTLQPFDAPPVAAPAFGLPAAAADLFLPQAAGPGVTATSADSGSSSTSAPPAWLLATSTGLLMLVGAGHFVRMTTRNLNIDE